MWQLPWRDRWLLFEAMFLVSIVGLSLKAFSIRRVCAILSRSRGRVASTADATQALARGRQVARLVEIASRHTPLPNTCLHRSLALWWLLGRRGVECRLGLGSRRQEGRFEAHAWVEHGDVVLAGGEDEGPGYVRLSWSPLKDEA